MSHRIEEKEARREARQRAEAEARRVEGRQRLMRHAGYGAIGVSATVLVLLALLLRGTAPTPAPAPVAGAIAPADVGAKAPDFRLTDVVSGQEVSAVSLRGEKTMLFFSEGINCQACMVQAADLERAETLEQEDIQLVSVTNDRPSELAQAAQQYGITTPLLADPTTEMTARYGMLGHGGMGHPTVAGHAFMLLDEDGTVRWHRAYQEMYVEPGQLLEDMKAEVTA